MRISSLEYQRRYERLGCEIHGLITNHEASDKSCYVDLLRANIDRTLMDFLREGILLFRPSYTIRQIPDREDYDIHFDPDHLERCFGEIVNG